MTENKNGLVAKTTGEVTSPEPIHGGPHFVPRVDVYETGDELVFQCDMPGVKPADLDLRFENGELTLLGKVHPRKLGAHVYLNEYGVGDFFRTFNVRTEVEPDKIAAEFKHGVLTVHLPKKESIKPKKIKIKAL